jgi:arylsulfatase A-like enzyme
MKSRLFGTLLLASAMTFGGGGLAHAMTDHPDIVVIMGDDVGIWNISAYNRGMMGGSTPNIDRIANQGALFTDYYAQQSCTAGRAAFILGQTPFRTGLLEVGLPAAKQGLQDRDPTIADLLKPLGYTSAQIGKNHLGDRNEFLPTVHGFDGRQGKAPDRHAGWREELQVHLDGYNLMPYLKGDTDKGPRHEFFYFSDDGDLMALRYDDWKISFKTIKGNLFTGTKEDTNVPLVTNLRQDPWERYQDESMMYARWWGEKLWTMIPAVQIVGQFLETFKEYPPSQRGGSISIERALAMVESGASGGGK